MSKIWLVATSMGYGHQRAAYPLKEVAAGGEIVRADNYPGIPEKDKRFWAKSRRFYEFISRFKSFPLLGRAAFAVFDYFQRIPKFFPFRDLSRPNFVLKQTYKLIKRGWGKHFIKRLEGEKPLVTTFATIAFMAEYFDYPGDIFCIVCDTDIARTWAPLDGKESRIKYFAPTKRASARLKMYGVKEENIIPAGHPLPSPNIKKRERDFKRRVANLNPKQEHLSLLRERIGEFSEDRRPLNLMFAIGGAGAQKEIGLKIMDSLSEKIKRGEVSLVFSVGTRKSLKRYFLKNAGRMRIKKGVEIVFAGNIEDYFQEFNKRLGEIDILWTKPSELCFFAALGLPLILAPTIGSQEEKNKQWILKKGAAVLQKNPLSCDKWLFDYLEQGLLAECALNGFFGLDSSGRGKIIEELTL